jgi:NADP-dependent 3-hydroxy acid dehydrogenase YdfG
MEIEEKYKEVHILINCAGVASVENILDRTEDVSYKIDKIININFIGFVHLTRKCLKLMNEYGIILNICSIAGHKVYSDINAPIYTSTKHAIRAFSESLKYELLKTKNEKIRVTNLSPGCVDTNMFKALEQETRQIKIDAKYVANAVLYLLSTPHHVNVTELKIQHAVETL